ncbi:transposase, partial [Arenibacter antarcticus]
MVLQKRPNLLFAGIKQFHNPSCPGYCAYRLPCKYFHVQKLASEAVQEERIRLRWEVIEVENKAIEEARKTEKTYRPELLTNGDTHRQLLTRSRYLLFKSKTKWTVGQIERAEVLFQLYPSIEKAYKLAQAL